MYGGTHVQEECNGERSEGGEGSEGARGEAHFGDCEWAVEGTMWVLLTTSGWRM